MLGRRPATKGAGGFTLLHLLLVLVALSAVAAVGIPMFFERPHVTLENGAVLLAEDLRTAQNRAAYSREPLFLKMLPDGDGYEVLDIGGEPIADPRTGRPFVRRYSIDGVFEGLHITEYRTGSDDTLVLSAQGETSDTFEVRLAFLGKERLVRAARTSGLVTIEGTTSGFVDDGL